MHQTAQFTQAIQHAGLRLTPQRIAICEVMAASDRHPTAQMIYDELRPRFPSLSLATVYNTLDTLVKLGLVNALGATGDDAIHYDADTSPHVNLACIECHRMIDLPSRHIQALENEVQHSSGYKLLGARVVYYGVCPECQGRKLLRGT
jgi:Fur family peroxide stress response transcriptional regulator